MLIFTEEEIRECVQMNEEVIEVVKSAFNDLVTKDLQMPPTSRVDIPDNNGEIVIKTAFIPGHEMFALKVSSHFFQNYSMGMSSTGGAMMLINALNGKPEAFFYDNGYLTDLRTGAAGALAAKYLANENIKKVGVIGTGAQARAQLQALKLVRDFKTVFVFGRTGQRISEFKHEIEVSLRVEVKIMETPEEVVKSSELLITATPSKEPIVIDEWIHPGMHITAVGADASHKQELDPKLIQKADRIACDVVSQCTDHGEIGAAMKHNINLDTSRIIELGRIITTGENKRQSKREITITDLTGTGAQDTKIALFAYKKLTEEK